MNKMDMLNGYIEEFFLLGGNVVLDKWKAFHKKLKSFSCTYGYDPQIDEMFILMQTYENEYQNTDFASSQKTVAPILERLINSKQWVFYDIRVLAQIIFYPETYEQVQTLAEMALQALEQYKDEKRYIFVKRAIHFNVILRLLKTKYLDIERIDITDHYVLNKLFDQHANAVLEICKQENFLMHEKIMRLRIGLFKGDYDVVDEQIEIIKNTEDKGLWKMAQDEVNDFNFHVGNAISSSQFNIMIGHNLKKIRKHFGMTIHEFAIKMNIWSETNLSLIESGQRGVSLYKMYKIVNVLGVKWTVFSQDIDDFETIFVTEPKTQNEISEPEFNAMISRNIKKVREHLGFSRPELAGILDVQRAAISFIEKAERGIIAHKLYKIATSWGVKWEAFFQEIDDVESVFVAPVSKHEPRQNLERIKRLKSKPTLELSGDEWKKVFSTFRKLSEEDFVYIMQVAEKISSEKE